MARYAILGAGRFGALALARLAAQDPGGGFVVIDRRPEALAPLQDRYPPCLAVAGDAVLLLDGVLRRPWPLDWIVPALPRHLAFAWWWERRPRPGILIPVPEAVGAGLPLVIRGAQGELYLSQADWICPDDCSELEDFCPVTGPHHRRPLYDIIKSLALPGFQTLVVPSRQLAPGVGGFAPQRLRDLEDRLAGAAGNWLIATACRCHGVVHAVSLK